MLGYMAISTERVNFRNSPGFVTLLLRLQLSLTIILLSALAVAQQDSNPANPANWILTKQVSGTTTGTYYSPTNSYTFTFNWATNTGSPVTTSGTTPASSTVANHSATLSYDVTYTYTLGWIGVGPAPASTFVKLSAAATLGGSPGLSGSTSDGLGNTPSGGQPWAKNISDSAYRKVDTSSGAGTITVEVTGNGSNVSSTGGVNVAGFPTSSCSIAPRAAQIVYQYDPTYTKESTGPQSYARVQNDTSWINPEFGDCACVLNSDGTSTSYPSGSYSVLFNVVIAGAWQHPTYTWSPTPTGAELTQVVYSANLTPSDIAGMVAGNPKELDVSCDVADPSGPGNLVSCLYKMFIYSPVSNLSSVLGPTYTDTLYRTPIYQNGGTKDVLYTYSQSISETESQTLEVSVAAPILDIFTVTGKYQISESTTFQGGVSAPVDVPPNWFAEIVVTVPAADGYIDYDSYDQYGYEGGVAVPFSHEPQGPMVITGVARQYQNQLP